MVRMLIDTDTASDDAIALMMALRHDEVDVEAVTVVAGNVGLDQAVQNAAFTVERCGASVPVVAGAAAPLLRDLETSQYVHGQDGMGDRGFDLAGRDPAPGRAADVLVDAILAAPGQFTLVALGPLTNLAVAVARAPEIVDAVGRVVVMGGTGVSGPGNVTASAEFNFWADPEAARLVVRSGLPLELVGWDVSIESARIDTDTEADLRGLGDLGELAMDVCTAVRTLVADAGLGAFDLPDPIAMAHAIDPTVAEVVRLATEVMVGDGPQRGVMAVDRLGFTGAPPNVDIVTHYPRARFLTLLESALR